MLHSSETSTTNLRKLTSEDIRNFEIALVFNTASEDIMTVRADVVIATNNLVAQQKLSYEGRNSVLNFLDWKIATLENHQEGRYMIDSEPEFGTDNWHTDQAVIRNNYQEIENMVDLLLELDRLNIAEEV